jgi:Zn-dependent protease with chaperone function
MLEGFSMTRLSVGKMLLALSLLSSMLYGADKPEEVKLDGYCEWRQGQVLIIDGQRVMASSETEFKGKGDARNIASIPPGYECKAEGYRRGDGVVLAEKIEAKPNGSALFEGEVKAATDQLEAQYRQAGMAVQPDGRGGTENIGRLHESGPGVDRVRAIINRLAPPYLSPNDLRVYVIDNPEWNAFAMGNYSFYVYQGLLNDMDDDELAIVLGHELVHASHEHSRRQAKRDMWIQFASVGAVVAADQIDNNAQRTLVQIAAGLTSSAFHSGYGRDQEDQADRVGLRYAYEAGYDVTKGPELWRRFADRYGEQNAAANFFFGDHSLSVKRAEHLREELALNYPNGPKH